jgi:hypothetical protein
MDLHVEETLWGVPGPEFRTAQLERPANRVSRLKFPDPIWGRVDIRDGARILLVTPPGAGRDDKPLYVDEISSPGDPVLLSIRDVLAAESRPHTAIDRFRRLLTWMNAEPIHRLYAGEALATVQALSAEETAQAVTALAEAFIREQDEFIKVSFGTWLWDGLFPRATEASRIVILNATIQTAASQSSGARRLALDRLSQTSAELLRNPAVKPGHEAVRLLEERRDAETDAAERESLAQIIAALRR